MRLLIAITGASGTIYAQRLLDQIDPRQHEVHVMLSQYAPQVIEAEQPGGLRLPDGAQVHNHRSMNLPFASGSNPPDVMVVIPCSMGTLGRIAHGLSSDSMLRCADVMLKERRKLILVPRETPISLVHVKNFELLIQAGTLYPSDAAVDITRLGAGRCLVAQNNNLVYLIHNHNIIVDQSPNRLH